MSTKIRLARAGRKGKPFYHVVVADIRSKRDGKFIEKLGHYDPLAPSDSENRFKIKQERVEYWLEKGAVPSERVAIFLCKMGVKGAQKYKPVFTPKAKKVVATEKVVPSESAAIEVSDEKMPDEEVKEEKEEKEEKKVKEEKVEGETSEESSVEA